MAYRMSKGKRGLGDITFEDDADTGIDFEPDTIKLETGGAERLVVTNTNTLFNTPIRTTSIEYTDGDDAITIDDGGYLKIHSGIKYSRSVLVSSTSSPSSPPGGWIKFATFSCPGTSGLDVAASSFLITLAGMESANNRALDGTFMVHAKFTNNPAAGNDDFDPKTDLIMIFPNNTATPDVDLYIRACAKQKRCFVTHLGGTGQTDTFDTDVGWTINTGQTWLSSEPSAPANNVKLTGTWASKIFSKVGIGTNSPKTTLDVHHNPTSLENDTGGGEVVNFGSGTLTAGKLYYLNNSGAWTEVDADAVASGADQLLGIALGSNPATDGVLIRGFFDAHTYLSNFSAGKAVYISTTAGGMDTTAPSGAGDFVRIVGYCTTTANVIYFNPSTTWVEL